MWYSQKGRGGSLQRRNTGKSVSEESQEHLWGMGRMENTTFCRPSCPDPSLPSLWMPGVQKAGQLSLHLLEKCLLFKVSIGGLHSGQV